MMRHYSRGSMSTRELVAELYNSHPDFTLGEVATIASVSKQRVHQIREALGLPRTYSAALRRCDQCGAPFRIRNGVICASCKGRALPTCSECGARKKSRVGSRCNLCKALAMRGPVLQAMYQLTVGDSITIACRPHTPHFRNPLHNYCRDVMSAYMYNRRNKHGGHIKLQHGGSSEAPSLTVTRVK